MYTSTKKGQEDPLEHLDLLVHRDQKEASAHVVYPETLVSMDPQVTTDLEDRKDRMETTETLVLVENQEPKDHQENKV